MYDSLGNQHNITFYFTKTGDSTWEWNALLEEAGIPDDEKLQATGTLTFDAEGALINYGTEGSGPTAHGFAGLSDQQITIDFGAIKTDEYHGFAGTTQFAGNFSTLSITQGGGYEAGSLLKISITREGKIQGLFTNQHTQDIALIALADFTSPDGLKQMGNNLYTSSMESGQAFINPPGAGGKGEISSYTLEGSNVDLATEFMKMIITQRAFQANSRMITTADQLITEIVSLKR